MIALDTNLLIHAHRRDSSFHGPASECLAELAAGRAMWCLPWPCLHEFYGIVTHPRVFRPPSTPAEAADQIDAWLECPSLVLLTETDAHWPTLRSLVTAARLAGPPVHDARIAALCIQHGVSELWTADRDFSRFPALRTRNPLIGG